MTHDVNLYALAQKGTQLNQTLSCSEIGSIWQNKQKVCYPATKEIKDTYLQLYFPVAQKYNKQKKQKTDTNSKIYFVGQLGLGLCTNYSYEPYMSIEAFVLIQLIEETEGNNDTIPDNIMSLTTNWLQNMCFFVFNENNGWRGLICEYRLWRYIQIQKENDINSKQPIPVIRQWYSREIYDDLVSMVGEQLIDDILEIVKELNFRGIPDLMLYSKQQIWFVEVKSINDYLKNEQIHALLKLSKIKGVTCTIAGDPSKHDSWSNQLQKQHYSDDSDDSD